MFRILTLIVNWKWYACKNWTSSLKLVVILAQYRYTKTAQRIFKYSDIQYISLTLDKILNSLVYRTLFYVNIYGSYKLLKTVRFFGPPCIWACPAVHLRDTSQTRQFAYILDTSPAAFFAYGHRKNTYLAIHTAAVSIVIKQFLLYIVLCKCINYVKSSRRTVHGVGELSSRWTVL